MAQYKNPHEECRGKKVRIRASSRQGYGGKWMESINYEGTYIGVHKIAQGNLMECAVLQDARVFTANSHQGGEAVKMASISLDNLISFELIK